MRGFYIRKIKPYVSQLQFRRELVKTLLFKYGSTLKVRGRPCTSISSVFCSGMSDDKRYGGIDYRVIPTPDKKKKRKICAGEGCAFSIRTMCLKCNVGLCIECFRIFHAVPH